MILNDSDETNVHIKNLICNILFYKEVNFLWIQSRWSNLTSEFNLKNVFPSKFKLFVIF